jgi:L-threonylcarbamoyladenylate synthase
MLQTRILTVDANQPDPAVIAQAAEAIRHGRLVAFPTETVYGLGANALDPGAVARIFEAKGRPATDPLIVHLAHIGQLSLCASHVPAAARKLGLAFWGGPLTIILPKKPQVPDSVTAGLSSVALRVPAHRVARALMEMAGVPVAAPSANRFSRPSPTTAAHVLADLDGRIDVVLDGGATDIGVESTIVDFTQEPPVMRRPGGLTLEQIRTVVPEVVAAAGRGSADVPQLAPGQLTRHYAPHAELTLYLGPADRIIARVAADARTLTAQGARVGILAPEEDLLALAPELAASAAAGRVEVQPYGARTDPGRSARELFAAMRTLDATGITHILATSVGIDGLGLAVLDRLTRAADGRVRQV